MLLETMDPPTSTPGVAGLPAPAALMQMLFGKHITYCLSAVARLGVADHMSQSPVPVETLAANVGAHSPSLYRVMRMLSSVDVFQESTGKRFALRPIGELLKTDTAGSMRYSAIQMGERWSTRAMEHFTDSVRTGKDGITQAFGKNVFEYFADQPEEADVFNRSMTNFSSLVVEPIIDSYDFSTIERLADIGGGHGMLLASILRHHPHMNGVVYDLPEVVFSGTGSSHFVGCENRVEFEGGASLKGRQPAATPTL